MAFMNTNLKFRQKKITTNSFSDHAVFANFKFKDIKHLNEKNEDKVVYLKDQNFIVKNIT